MSEELRRSLLARFVEAVPALVLICRLTDLRIEYLNEAAKARLNPDGRADIGKLTLFDVTGVSSLQRVQAEIMPQARVLGKWSGDCDLRDVWGGEFAARVTFQVHTQGPRNAEGYLCVHALERSDARSDGVRFTDRDMLHALMEHAPDLIFFKDAASRFLRISRPLAETLRLDNPGEVIGRTDFDFFPADQASAAYAAEQKIMRTGEPIIDQEERITWKDGHVTWVATTKLPFCDAAGRLIGTFGISRDITARRQAEQSRREMELQLQLAQKMESIGRLAAGIAHEINTPTQFITDNTHFLSDAFLKLDAVLDRYRGLRDVAARHADCAEAVMAAMTAETESEIDYLTSEIPRCVQQTLDGLTRVARIVCSMKEFAHPNSPDLTAVALDRIIETSLVVSRHEWRFVAEVGTEFDPAMPPVPCVVDEFNQVMLNLIINAAHAIKEASKRGGPDRGKITIRTRHLPPWAVIEVEDTGTGIAPEIRDRIFEPFFTTKPTGQGTGQGLAIVRAVVVNRHHGEIDLTTTPGTGTTFIIRLPLVAPPTSSPSHDAQDSVR